MFLFERRKQIDREYLKLLQQEQEGTREQLMNVLNKVKRDDGPKLPLKEHMYDEILELDEMEYTLVNLGIVYPRGMLAHLLLERAQVSFIPYNLSYTLQSLIHTPH